MPRPLRIEYRGVFYHKTSRGNEGMRMYFAKSDYGKFKEKGRRYHCQFVQIQGLPPFFFEIWLKTVETQMLVQMSLNKMGGEKDGQKQQ